MQDSRTSVVEMLEELADLGMGLAIIVMPLFLICLPGIILVVVPAVLLAVAAAVPVVAALALAGPPCLVVRALRRRRARKVTSSG